MITLTDSDQRVLHGSNYIHTTAPKFKKNNAIDYNGLVHGICKTSLISLIYGMQQKEFGFDTIYRVIRDIDRYNDMHCCDGGRMRDSAGYDIITGNCRYEDIYKFINCYTYALNSHSHIDRILSLDIPFFINDPKRCDTTTIYELNKKSLSETIKVIQKTPQIKNKMMFIQQFKMPQQYAIFSKLYKELEVWKYMEHSSTGGLVGIGAATNINFAPFIGPVFLAFSRFLAHKPDSGFFDHHVLGQYHLHARFCIAFLEALFKSLDCVFDCKITYDSINFFLSSTLKLRAEHKYCRLQKDAQPITYRNLTELDRNELPYVYPENVIPDIEKELDIIKGGNGNVKDVSFAVPLYAFSQLQIDELFHQLVVEYDMISVFKNARNNKELTNQFNAIINSVHSRYASILGAQFTKKLLRNIQLCYAFYSAWYVNDRSEKKIDDLMQKFIKKINFPCDLT